MNQYLILLMITAVLCVSAQQPQFYPSQQQPYQNPQQQSQDYMSQQLPFQNLQQQPQFYQSQQQQQPFQNFQQQPQDYQSQQSQLFTQPQQQSLDYDQSQQSQQWAQPQQNIQPQEPQDMYQNMPSQQFQQSCNQQQPIMQPQKRCDQQSQKPVLAMNDLRSGTGDALSPLNCPPKSLYVNTPTMDDIDQSTSDRSWMSNRNSFSLFNFDSNQRKIPCNESMNVLAPKQVNPNANCYDSSQSSSMYPQSPCGDGNQNMQIPYQNFNNCDN